jgi:hypothetical protein
VLAGARGLGIGEIRGEEESSVQVEAADEHRHLLEEREANMGVQ